MIEWIMKRLHRTDKHYVSETDTFLAELNDAHPLSASQAQEKAKHERIARLRDKVAPDHVQGDIWRDF